VLTLLISGCGTGVGKTHVTAALTRVASRQGQHVQIIKPVQTGATATEPTDADCAAALAQSNLVSAHTLRSYPAALSPLSAAKAVNARLHIADLVRETLALPQVDVRLIEGAGGLAVPLDENGADWMDFAIAVRADAIVLVVPDQLGAINLARLVHHYFLTKTAAGSSGGIFLNALTTPTVEIAASTRAGLASCAVPIWGELGAGSLEATLYSPLAELLGT
jgi:dethiobiotin synthase